MLNPIERLAPQMAEYNRFGDSPRWLPYLMFAAPGDYRSTVVNTDSRGLRLSVDARGAYAADTIGTEPCNLLVGNSVAFGVGATSDASTIASQLSRHPLTQPGERWVNFTGRAYSGWQELIMFLAYRDLFPNLRRVVILSGLNDLYFSFAPRMVEEVFGPFLFTERFQTGVGNRSNPGRRQLVRQLFQRQRALLPEDMSADVERRWQMRDQIVAPLRKSLSAWAALARGSGFTLHYMLQPMAPFIDRQPSPEETELFTQYDQQASPLHRLFRLVLTKQRHDWYSKALSGICNDLGVAFTDLNPVFPKDGWCFIDRIHLTDEGQRKTADLILNTLAGSARS